MHDLQAAVAGGLCIPSLREPQLLQRGVDETQYERTQCRWVDNVVFMGMGEPLHNCEQVMRAVGLLTHPKGRAMAARRITVSTSGVVPAITRLMTHTGVHLALSLNATTDEVRARMMPVNRKWPLQQLLDCCRALPLAKRRRITFEYVLLAGVNDSLQDAGRLVRLLADLSHCRVNLIPFNPHPLSHFQRPAREDVLAFQRLLLHKGINVFIRRTRGDDVDAACGMLGGKTLQQARQKSSLPVLSHSS
ncbi:MAG: radical SAM protein [Myxococcota bacterium]